MNLGISLKIKIIIKVEMPQNFIGKLKYLIEIELVISQLRNFEIIVPDRRILFLQTRSA